jgi:hypothetical protein
LTKRKYPSRKAWYHALGAKLNGQKGLFFLDLDSTNFDIYKTKHGIHLIARLNRPFDYMFDRIRISPKYEERTGEIVNPAPKLFLCNCPNGQHVDKRLEGKLEIYPTWSK